MFRGLNWFLVRAFLFKWGGKLESSLLGSPGECRTSVSGSQATY